MEPRWSDASPSDRADPRLEPDVPDEDGEGESGVGDLVVIPYPRVRQHVGCGERAGVVLEGRRGAVKAFFPSIDRAFWLDRDKVVSIAEDRLPLHPLARRLHRVCRALDAARVEIYDREGDADVFHVYTRGTTLDALVAVREALGADFRRLSIDPGGVKKARVTLVVRTDAGPDARA